MTIKACAVPLAAEPFCCNSVLASSVHGTTQARYPPSHTRQGRQGRLLDGERHVSRQGYTTWRSTRERDRAKANQVTLAMAADIVGVSSLSNDGKIGELLSAYEGNKDEIADTDPSRETSQGTLRRIHARATGRPRLIELSKRTCLA